ncbi:MAG TPA: carboxypeptidase regulatory-like domain-containing protein, partial [Acidimicrobiia bacterium]|nr:carboxypeptidase regulatory-like domain-containing protein [Acidimicrobiia bacterium]
DGTFTIQDAIPGNGGGVFVNGGSDYSSGYAPLDVPPGETLDAGTITLHHIGSLTGLVHDDRSQPVAGLTVRIVGGNDYTTGSDGTFNATDVPAGQYTVIVFGGDNYTNYESSVTVNDGPAATDLGTVVVDDAAPDGFAALSGKVSLSDGTTAAPNVSLVAKRADNGAPVGSATSDMDGAYTIANLPTALALHVEITQAPNGYKNTSRDYTLDNREVRHDDVTLDTGGFSVHGTVTLGSSPAGGVHVWALNGPNGHEVTTDSDGHYAISGLDSSAVYYLCVHDVPDGISPECYDHVRFGELGSLQLASGVDQQIDFSLTRYGSISGRVVGANGDPIADATVQLPNAWFTVSVPSATTASDGTFTLSTVPPVNNLQYDVTATGYSGHRFTIDSVTPDGTDQVGDLTLHALGSVTGRVVDGSGNPVEGMAITANPSGHEATSSADGTFTIDQLDAGAGEYSFADNSNGDYAPAIHEHVTVSEGPGATEIGDLTVHRYGSVTGRVVDSVGNPVAGLTVQLDGANDTTTGSDGTYTFSRVIPGGRHVDVLGSSNYGPAGSDLTVADGPDATTTDDLTVYAWSHITGTVTGDSGPVSGLPVSISG